MGKEEEGLSVDLIGEGNQNDSGDLFSAFSSNDSIVLAENYDRDEEKKVKGVLGTTDIDEIDDEKKRKSLESEEEEEEDVLDEEQEEEEQEDIEEGSPEEALKYFSNTLKSKGIIDFDDSEFEGKEEWIYDQVAKTIESGIEAGVNGYKRAFPPELIEIAEHWEEGVPYMDLLKAQSAVIEYENLSREDLQKESVAKKVVKDFLLMQNMDPADADEEIEELDAMEGLEKRAATVLPKIKKYRELEKNRIIQEAKQQEADRRAQYEVSVNKLKDKIYSSKEIIPGIKLSKIQADKLFNGIVDMDRRGKTALQNAREQDPDFDLKVAYMAIVQGWDFEKVSAKAETKAAGDLAKKVGAYSKKSGNYKASLRNSRPGVLRNLLNN